MKGLNYRPGFDDKGRALPWLNALKNQSGAYVLRNAASKAVLYVGESHSGTLAATIKRHFRPWPDTPDRIHHVYQRGRMEIAVRLTPPNSAIGAQDNLIRRLEPRDNGYTPVEKPF